MKRSFVIGGSILTLIFLVGMLFLFLSLTTKLRASMTALENSTKELQQEKRIVSDLRAEHEQLMMEHENLTNEFYEYRSRAGQLDGSSPRTPLSSYMPERCLPSDDVPATVINEGYSITQLGCGDANWWYQATLVRNASSSEDIVAYRLSNQGLTWKTLNGKEHILTTIGNRAWDSFQDYGGDNPVTVTDFTLDGKPLHLLKEPFTYKDGGLGAFQDVYFLTGSDQLTATLSLQGGSYAIDFEKVTVKPIRSGEDR